MAPSCSPKLNKVFGMPLGGLVDRYSPRAVIFWGITVWSLAAMSCGLARSFGELFIARMIVGVGEACLMPAAFAIIGGIVQPRRMAISISIDRKSTRPNSSH